MGKFGSGSIIGIGYNDHLVNPDQNCAIILHLEHPQESMRSCIDKRKYFNDREHDNKYHKNIIVKTNYILKMNGPFLKSSFWDFNLTDYETH